MNEVDDVIYFGNNVIDLLFILIDENCVFLVSFKKYLVVDVIEKVVKIFLYKNVVD